MTNVARRNAEPTICIITPGQPSSNPRVVKEADALVSAGYNVHVVCAHWADWATAMDQQLLATRRWTTTFIDWRREQAPVLFNATRVRYWLARRASRMPAVAPFVQSAALNRIGPELRKASLLVPADLYIAHYPAALLAAEAAARKVGAVYAFDAEDFHSGQLSAAHERQDAAFLETIEREHLPRCAYVSAASPLIADAYARLCDIETPTCILNVFPLGDRPSAFRPDRPSEPVRLYWFSQTIGPNRGLEDAVQAIGLLRNHSLELHVRGRWQPGYEQRLRALADSCGLPNGTLVSHEPAPSAEMLRLAGQYDIGLALEPPVSLNNDILIPNKIFTYLPAGVAVAATRTRGQYVLADDLGPSTVWSTPGAAPSLADALLPWLTDRASLVAARKAAWDLGERRFNWDLEQARFLELVAGALARRNRPSATSSPAAARSSSAA